MDLLPYFEHAQRRKAMDSMRIGLETLQQRMTRA
jgi:hypothetical protein